MGAFSKKQCKTTLPSTYAVYQILVHYKGMHSSEIQRISGIPLKFATSKVDKGVVGRYTELLAGLRNGPHRLDCSDGDVKSVKYRNYKRKGRKGMQPAETLAITTVLDCITNQTISNFKTSSVYQKIERMVVLGICMDEDGQGFTLVEVVLIDFQKHADLVGTIAREHQACEEELLRQARNGKLKTVNGNGRAAQSYLQVRTKDSRDKNGKYHPITFNGVEVSDKNRAFYFTRHGISRLLSLLG